MKYAITEEQFLIYNYGEKKARGILDNNLPDHYRTAYQKLQNGEKFVWNWAAFFFSSCWLLEKRLYPSAFFSSLIFCFVTGFLILTAMFAGYSFFTLLMIFLLSVLISSPIFGYLGDKTLINFLSKQLKKKTFDDLSEETKTAFIKKSGLTEEKYLSFIYGEEKAKSLLQYNIPDQYRRAFAKLATGQKMILNWPAGIFSYAWFIFRRLPHFPLIAMLFSFIIGIVLGIIEGITQEENQFLALVIMSIFSISLVLIPYIFADYFLINYISKQIRKGNFDAHPKGGNFNLTYTNIAINILSIALATPYFLKADPENIAIGVLIINIAMLSVVNILPIIAIIHNKFKIRQYKKSLKEKS